MSTIFVRSKSKDVLVPMEGRKGVFFSADADTEVTLTRYIQRRLDDKDLIVVQATAAARPAAVPPPASQSDAPGADKKAGS